MATTFYRGLAFPFKRGEQAIPDAAYDEELLRQSVLQILMTSRGERVMRPTFGSDIQSYVFENNNELTQQLLRTELSAAVAQAEGRVQLQDIFLESSDATLTITVDFVVVATRTLNRLSLDLPRNTSF